MSELIWHKERKPAVTTCCSSLNWAETNRGTLCYKCGKVTGYEGKRTATAEDMRKNGINYTEGQFNEAYSE